MKITTLEEFAQLFEELFPKHDFNWRQYPTRWMALCPFHDDSRPSFNIYEIGGRLYYKCFACGASGSPYDLLKEAGGIDEKEGGTAERPQENLYKRALQFIDAAFLEMQKNYTTTYLQKKVGEGDLEEAIRFYRIGLISESLLDFNNPFIKRLEEKVRISSKIGWLVFPYYSLSGHLVAIKFRNIAESSRSSRVFKVVEKKIPCYFGGLGFLEDFIRRPDGWVYPVIVTEGETDAISCYMDSYIPTLAVGSASNYSSLLEDRLSQYNFFPIIFPDFDPFSLASMGAGRESVKKLFQERKRKKVYEKIYVLTSEESYKGEKDINDAIVRKGVNVREILSYGRIEELTKAVKTFEREWQEFKKRKFMEKADTVKKNLPALDGVYADFLGLNENDSLIELSASEIFNLNNRYPPPVLGRFPISKISVISSFGGSGKTTFALMTALKVAIKENLQVLFWTTEHDPKSIKRKLRQLSFLPDFWDVPIEKSNLFFRFGAPEPFISLDKRRLNPRAFEQLEELFERYDVIFLDPLLSFVAGDENDNMLIRAVFDRIHSLLAKEKFADKRKALVVLHHFNKLALREAIVKQEDINESESGEVSVKQEIVQKLLSAVRGASAVVDSARYVEAIIKTDKGRYCVTIKTNEDTRQAGRGEVIPELRPIEEFGIDEEEGSFEF